MNGCSGRTMATSLLAAALVLGGGSVPMAEASGSKVSAGSATSPTFDDPQLQAEYDFVMWVAMNDPRRIVRDVAWRALLTEPVADSIRRFRDTDYAYAVQLAAARTQIHRDFVDWVLAAYSADVAPNVVAAAKEALAKGASQQEYFYTHGYTEAREADRRARQAAADQAQKVKDADRALVAELRDHAPGEQVRLAAGHALRAGAGDWEIADFFASEWMFSAGLDLEVYQKRMNDQEATWWNSVGRLVTSAEQAESTLGGPAGGEPARQAARTAWAAVESSTVAPLTEWVAAEEAARTQVAHWKVVVESQQGVDRGAALSRQLQATLTKWQACGDAAASRVGYWATLRTTARAAQERLTG